MVEEMSAEKKTIDVQGIKTRKILFQNPDNTYPPPLTFLTMGDAKGHAGWGNTVDTVNARELNSSYDITVNYPAQGTNTLRFTTDAAGCWIEAGATAVAGSAAKLFINNYADRGTPVATFDIANNRVGINNMTPTCALDVTGGTIKGATLDMQSGYAKIANLDIYDTLTLMPGATMILPVGNNLIVDTLYGNKVVAGTTATGAYTDDLTVVGTMKCTGLGTFAGGITASGATFSGLATCSAGITGTTATFSSLATFSGGITGTTATFSGGITGTTATFSSLATFSGGITGTTATFSGGITGTTATFSGGITAASATVNGTITAEDVVIHETLQVDKTIVCDEDVSAHTFTATSGGGLAVGGIGNRVLNVRTDTVGTYIEVGQAISGSGALLNISTIDNTQQTAVFDTTNKQVGIRTVPVLADGFALDVNGTVRTNGYINMQVGVPRSLVYMFNLTADIDLNTSAYTSVCTDTSVFQQLVSYNVILATVSVPVGSSNGGVWSDALGNFFMKLSVAGSTDSQVYHLMTGGSSGNPASTFCGYGMINQQFVLVKNTHYTGSSTSLTLNMLDESGNTFVKYLNNNSASTGLQVYIAYLGLV